MKTNKVLLIVQTVMMYISQIPLYALLIMANMSGLDEIKDIMAYAYLISTLLIIPLCFVNAIFAIVALFKGNSNPSKLTMIIKFVLVPWYVLNFVICGAVILGLLNPWFFLAAPIVAFVLISVTYIFMLSTSLPDMAFYFHKLFKREAKIKPVFIVAIIFMFCFCLDTIGGLLFFLGGKDL